MSIISDISQGVVDRLKGGTFTQTFEPVRQNRPNRTLKELQKLQVTVVPKARDVSIESRSTVRHAIEIDVGIQKKIDSDQDIDVLLGVVDEILDRLKFVDAGGALWQGIDNDPVFALDVIDEHRVFLSVLTVRYMVVN